MNKKIRTFIITLGVLSCSTFAAAQSDAPKTEPELRPSQIAMRARAGWVKAMNENLTTSNFEAVKKDATALSAQTAAAAEKQPAGLAKELTLKLSSLATATAEAAGTKNGATTKMKLAEAQAVCAECHAKIRDKK
jgi:hypothetical protein